MWQNGFMWHFSIISGEPEKSNKNKYMYLNFVHHYGHLGLELYRYAKSVLRYIAIYEDHIIHIVILPQYNVH